ncbi:MAG: hypothetical protein KF799_11385 [Bdellovibrionales bacterium]|nr:hypothetical protein [Bdellovibrionales bacterium]
MLKSFVRNILTLITLTASVTACVKGGQISSSGSSSETGAITVTLVYPTASGASWSPIIDTNDNNRYHIKGLNLTIAGICSRGVSKIMVNAYTETATCQGDGSFTFSKTYLSGAQGDITLTLTAYDSSDALISGSTATTYVRIDATAPSAPVISTPSGSPYEHSGSDAVFQILGSVSTDTVKLTGPGGVTITPSGTSWSHDVTLTPGSTLDFTFYSYDLAGNQSAGTTQTIEWSPNISLKAAGAFPGSSTITDGVSGFKLEAAIIAYPGSVNDNGASGMTLQTGFNYITNSVRAN